MNPVKTPLPTEKSAVLSPCGRYRYALTRLWDEAKPGALFCMLNPSTADHERDDPTIRRLIGFARAWGMGSVTVVNLFAYRTPYPSELVSAAYVGVDVVGPENDRYIREQVKAHGGRGDYCLAAWGGDTALSSLQGRRDRVVELLPLADLQCLGMTQKGEPRHPLYCRADLTPVPYEVSR